MPASFFLGRIVEDDAYDFAFRDKLDCQADDSTPELPSFVVEGAPQEDIES